jgi:riboflavin synthase alpha subunit
MFTGLVESLAEITALVPEGPGVRLYVRDALVAENMKLGDSI